MRGPAISVSPEIELFNDLDAQPTRGGTPIPFGVPFLTMQNTHNIVTEKPWRLSDRGAVGTSLLSPHGACLPMHPENQERMLTTLHEGPASCPIRTRSVRETYMSEGGPGGTSGRRTPSRR